MSGVAGVTGRVGAGWRRYLQILAVCWRAAVSTELEYRVDFWSKVALSAFWMAWAAVGVSVFFRFTGDVAGWSYAEVLVVVGLFFALNGLRQAVFEPNLDRMTDYVRRGTLDFLLTKPVDAQLLVSLRHLAVTSLVDLPLGLSLVAVGLVLAGRAPSPASLGAFALCVVVAVVLLWATTVVLMALSIRLVGAEDLGVVSFSAVELSRFPVQAYRDPLQTVLTVVPVVFLTTVPAQALLGRLDPWLLVVGPVVAVASVALATLVWRRSLAAYTGASA